MEIILLIVGLLVGAGAAYLVLKSKSVAETVGAEERAAMLKKQLADAEGELVEYRQVVVDLEKEASRVLERNANLEARLAEEKKELEEVQKKLKIEFEVIAHKLLEDKSQKFTEQNKTNMKEILDPLKEKIKDFEQKVERGNKESLERNAALREQLAGLKDLNKQMSEDAQNLVKALKGDTKTQGDWGELQLEKILERSGLRKGIEYSTQESFTSEDGKRRRPDVLINLPDDKKIVVDSKVSLVHYEQFVTAEDQEEQNAKLKLFIQSVKNHIRDLHGKEYHELGEGQKLDFVLMFIPIEPAFSLAVQYGENLYVEAYDKNIVIVSPSTLLATLRTIANIWKQEYQNRNVLEIAQESGKLYDKFVGFVDDMLDMGKKMDQAKKSYEGAMNKLSTGTGNLVRKAEQIKSLGAKASKQLPQNLLDRAADEDSELNELPEPEAPKQGLFP